LCAQLTRDLFAIAKFLLRLTVVVKRKLLMVKRTGKQKRQSVMAT